MTDQYDYDLVVIGAGSGGIVAAQFAAHLGARVALIERQRVGGDCTWTGCVPSKALIKVARVAHDIRQAAGYGIGTAPPAVDMARVRDYVRRAIATVYQYETPESLQAAGITVLLGAARFLDPHTIRAGEHTLTGKAILLCTGARPVVPDLPGLGDVPYVTYEQLFDNDRLPQHLVVIGGGPIGLEMAQAYGRLGAAVTVVAARLLPREEPEVQELLDRVLTREGLAIAYGRATRVAADGATCVVTVGDRQVRGDMLLVATGRGPVFDGLDLGKAGVAASPRGIPVDEHLRTSAKHIYAAGDCLGGYQFTHFAGWQAFQAARNALLPGAAAGFSETVPWVTFTTPEVARVGLSEAQARHKFGEAVVVAHRNLDRVDRAVCEHAEDGFLKIVHKKDGTLLGATIVADRAGETITEFVVALQHGLKVGDLASAIHAYPTYSTAVQQMAAEVVVTQLLGSPAGRVLRGLSGLGGK